VEAGKVVARARELYRDWDLAALPAHLQRNSLDYYYLSVWPGLGDLRPVEELTLPTRPREVRYAYVHLPFCSGVCDFCSYFLTTAKGDGDPKINRYLDQLLAQVDIHRRDLDITIASIYLGGGTPSILTPGQLAKLLGGLRERGILDPAMVGTMELHPELFADEPRLARTLEVLAQHGIRRVSIGYQSDDDTLLDATNRRHHGGFLGLAADRLRSAGFAFNVDLMYGLPRQSLDTWVGSIEAVLAVRPDSIATYFTFVDPGTLLWRRVKQSRERVASTEDAQLQHLAAQVALEDAGYHELPGDFWAVPTEDPAAWTQFALPSQANSLALGAGAYGYYPGVQYFNEFRFDRFATAVAAGRPPLWRAAVLTPAQDLARDVMFSLKNAPLLRLDLFRQRYGTDPVAAFPAQFDQLVRWGLVDVNEQAVRLTAKGRLVVEEIACLFAVDTPQGTVGASRVEENLIRKHHFAPTYGR
jgi:coproporphyrinogen III oxidase-like Fe-S oxidoreductase